TRRIRPSTGPSRGSVTLASSRWRSWPEARQEHVAARASRTSRTGEDPRDRSLTRRSRAEARHELGPESLRAPRGMLRARGEDGHRDVVRRRAWARPRASAARKEARGSFLAKAT